MKKIKENLRYIFTSVLISFLCYLSVSFVLWNIKWANDIPDYRMINRVMIINAMILKEIIVYIIYFKKWNE